MTDLILIDGNNAVHRNFHVMRDLINSSGFLVGGIFGYIRTILSLAASNPGSEILSCWDSYSRRRLELSGDEYKAHRREGDPDEIGIAISKNVRLSRNVTSLLGIRSLRVEGVEADDIIAQICRSNPHLQITILSTDKDFYQLLRLQNVEIDRQEKEGPLTLRNFQSRKNYTVDQYRLLHCILGDPGDNVPNISGVGEGSAWEVISSLTSEQLSELGRRPDFFDEVYSIAANHSKARVRKIAENIDRVRDNYDLVDLLDSPILSQSDIDDLTVQLSVSEFSSLDMHALSSLFHSLEFQAFEVVQLDRCLRGLRRQRVHIQ